MKKLIAMLLALLMLAGIAAGCGETTQTTGTAGSQTGSEEPVATTTEPVVIVPESALEVLQNVWNAYDPAERFNAVGGDGQNMVTGGPGNFSVENSGDLTAMFWVSDERVADVDQAASLMHGLNRNNFTCAVFHMTQEADGAVFAESWKDSMNDVEWVCGFPQTLLVAVVGGEYVLCAYGAEDTIGFFQSKLVGTYPAAQILYSEAIMA